MTFKYYLVAIIFIIFSSCKIEKQYKQEIQSLSTIDIKYTQSLQNKVFPFSFYSTANNVNEENCEIILRKMQQNGITMFGPYYGFNVVQCYKSAHKLGMKAIHRLVLYGTDGKNQVSYTTTPQNPAPGYNDVKSQIKNLMQEIVNDPIRNDVIAWWCVAPEELRYWRKNEMVYLTDLKKAIKETEKELNLKPRPLMMYEPNNRKAADLVNSGTYGLDIQMRGVYGNSIDDPNWTNLIEVGTQAVAESSVKLKNIGGVTLNLNKNYATDLSDIKARSYIRVASYIALLNGAQAIHIWSWATRAGLSAQNRDKQVEYYSSVALDLNGPLHLANIFLEGTRLDEKKILFVDPATNSEFLKYKIIHYNNSNYLFIINSSSSKKIELQSNLILKYEKYNFLENFKNKSSQISKIDNDKSALNLSLEPLDIVIIQFN